MKPSSFLALALCAAVAAAAAGEIAVSPNPAVVTANEAIQFTADGATSEIAWRVIPAGLGAIDATGRFTASGRPGRGIVRAIAIDPGGREGIGHAYVRVSGGPVQRLTVKVTPVRAVIRTGEASSFHALAFDAQNSEIPGAAISWTVVPAELGDIDPNGVFTARNPGEGRIVALASLPGSKGLGQARVSIVTAERPQRLAVELAPKRARAGMGGTVQFTAVISDQDGRPVEASLRFTVEPPALGTIDANGTFTAGAKPGTGIVRVIASRDKSIGSDRALLTVGAQAKRWVVRLTPRRAELRAGETVQFSAEAFDQDGNQAAPPSWQWRVIPERLGTITPGGLFTAGDRAITGRIVARLPSGYGQGSDAAAVRIRPGAPNQVRVDPPKALVRPGETQQFTATVTGPDGAPRADARVVWKVYPPGTGTITPNGLFTAASNPRLGVVIAAVPPDQGGGKGIAGIVVSNYYVRIEGPRPHHISSADPPYAFTAVVRDGGGNPVSGVVFQWSRMSISGNFGTIDQVTGMFTAGQPLAAQVEGMVYVKAMLNGQVIGGDGIKVIVHR